MTTRTTKEGPPAVEASVVIPLFDKLEYTRPCIDALLGQIGACGRHEIIAVDNGSSDGTPEYLRTLAGNVTTVRNARNAGFARACNQGARLAQGEYVVFLNNDTAPRPGWLDRLVEASRDSGAAVCGSKLLYPDGTVQHAGIAFNEERIGYHLYNGLPGNAPGIGRRRFLQAVTAACMLVRRDVFLALGEFDEGYRNGFEDIDFCLRAGARGYRVLYVPESVVVHFEGKTAGRKDNDLENLLRYLDRWGKKVEPDDARLYAEDGYRKVRKSDGTEHIVYVSAPLPEEGGGAALPGGGAPGGASLTAIAGKLEELGRAHMREKRYDEAWTAFERAYHMGNENVLCGMGDCRAAQGRAGDAAALYRKALGADPDNGRARRELAKIGAGGGPAPAPDGAGTPAERGRLRKKEKRYPEALEAFEAALAAGDATALTEIGDLKAAEGKIEEAETCYRDALERHAAEGKALVGLGVLRLLRGDAPGAGSCFESALDIDAADAAALCGLSLVRKTEGRAEDAHRLLLQSLSSDPRNLTALHELVKSAHELSRWEEAEGALRAYLAYAPSDANILFSLAGILYKAGRPREALDILDRLRFFAPGYAGAAELRAVIEGV